MALKIITDHVARRVSPQNFSPSSRHHENEEQGKTEENCRRGAADNKISSLKNPGALSRGYLINNDVEEPARRCSLGCKG